MKSFFILGPFCRDPEGTMRMHPCALKNNVESSKFTSVFPIWIYYCRLKANAVKSNRVSCFKEQLYQHLWRITARFPPRKAFYLVLLNQKIQPTSCLMEEINSCWFQRRASMFWLWKRARGLFFIAGSTRRVPLQEQKKPAAELTLSWVRLWSTRRHEPELQYHLYQALFQCCSLCLSVSMRQANDIHIIEHLPPLKTHPIEHLSYIAWWL